MRRGAEDPFAVLVVDDDAARGERVQAGLDAGRDGIRLRVVTDPAEAIETAAGVDCLLVERETPWEGGLAYLDRVRADHPDLPVVLYGDRVGEFADDALSAGAADVLATDTVVGRPTVLANRVENVVARRQAERSTETVRERFGRFLERPSDYVMTVDEEGIITYVTPSIRRVLGYAPEDVVGTNNFEYIHPDDRERAREIFGGLLDAAGAEATAEIRVRHDDGSYRQLETYGRNLIEDPVVGGIVVNVRDVTQQRTYTESLTALQEASRELVTAPDVETVCEEILAIARGVVDLPHAAVFLWDEGERKLVPRAVNQAMRDVFGDPPSFDRGEGIVGEVFATGEPTLLDDAQTDDRAIEDDRASEWIRGFVVLPLGDHGVMTAASPDVGAFDRTDFEIANVLAANATLAFDQIESQAELARQRDLFARAQTIARVGAWEYDPAADTITWSDEVARIFELPSDAELTHEAIVEYFHPEDRPVLREAFGRAIEDGEPFDLELRLGTGDRVDQWISVRGDPHVEDGSVVRVRGTINDVSERKENERHLDLLDRLLRHNLRNEMTVIRGYAESIREHAGDPARTWATEIIEQSDELLGSIEKEREIVKLLTGSSNRRRVDVSHRVRDLAEGAREAYPGATVTVDAPETATATATGKFDTALRELVENAVLHNDREDPTVKIAVERRPETVVIRVADDGPGIPEDDRAPIQQGLDTHDLYHGSGIGLWLVDWIVHRSGGSLWFADRDPRGTTVTMELPRETGTGDDA